MKTYNVAIAGATGAVGETMLSILEERNFPVNKLKLLASERSVGKKMLFKGKEIEIELLTKDSFKDIDFALFSIGGTPSKEFAPFAVESGAVVIDNSSAFRQIPEIPLVVPEINPEAAKLHKGIIANPNCTTIIMLMALKPLYDFAKVKRVVASSYQAASGAGAKGVSELYTQTRDWSNDLTPRVDFFAHQLLHNVIPHIDVFMENGYTKEEMKMFWESQKILGDSSIKVSATCVRVPVATAHSIAVTAEFENKISVEKARELLSKAPGVTLYDQPSEKKYPMPLMAAGKDNCFVGRLREDISAENTLSFFVCGDQLRKGAALNAVQIAELLIK